MVRLAICVACIAQLFAQCSLAGENPEPQTAETQILAGPESVPRLIEQLGAPEFVARRQAFLQLWSTGSEVLHLVGQAKLSANRQVSEAARVLELLIELKISPSEPGKPAKLLTLISQGDIDSMLELCKLKYWTVAERILQENPSQIQLLQEPQGRYSICRFVEAAMQQGDLELAWPIVRLATPTPQRVWIAHKSRLALDLASPADNFSKAYGLFFAGDIDAALEVPAPAMLRLPMITRSGRWQRLLDEPILKVLCGRQQSSVQQAVEAMVYEFAGEIETSEKKWDTLLSSPANADPAASEASSSDSAFRLLQEIDSGGLGVQAGLNQLLAALLLSGRTEPLERFLMSKDEKSAAFSFYLAGHNYSQAFESIGLKADLSNFDEWLSVRKSQIEDELQRKNTNSKLYDESTRLCAALSGLGCQTEAESLLQELVTLAKSSRQDPEVFWSRSIITWLARSEARAMALQAAKSEFQTMTEGCKIAVLEGLFPEFGDAAASLWQMAPSQVDSERWTDMERLYVFDKSHFGEKYSATISRWLRDTLGLLQNDELGADHLRALAEIALGFGDTPLALDFLLIDTRNSNSDDNTVNLQWIDAGRILLAKGETQEAAKLLALVRESGNNLQQAYVYETQSLARSGLSDFARQIDRSRWMRPLATTRFYQGLDYLQASRQFSDRNEFEHAAEYAEAAFLLAECGSMDVYWSASDYSNILNELDERQRAADVLRAALVEALQPYSTSMQYLVNNSFFSSLRFAAQKERLSQAVANILNQDFQLAQRNIDVGRKLQPQDIEMVVQCYPLLIEAGKQEMADRLFNEYEQSMLDQIKDWPLDATTLNNLAWMYAKSDRKLQEALQLSQTAVNLAPNSAVFLDTLAEIEFRSGLVDSAIASMRECVRMDPREIHYRENLVRFREPPATDPQ